MRGTTRSAASVSIFYGRRTTLKVDVRKGRNLFTTLVLILPSPAR